MDLSDWLQVFIAERDKRIRQYRAGTKGMTAQVWANTFLHHAHSSADVQKATAEMQVAHEEGARVVAADLPQEESRNKPRGAGAEGW